MTWRRPSDLLEKRIWVIKYLGDIESDLSAFHRVDDFEDISSRRFFLFVDRLLSYKGALRFTAEQEAEESKKSATGRERSSAPVEYSKIEQNQEAFRLGIIEKG